MNPFRSLHDYEEFIYTLKLKHSSIKHSTLILIRRGKRTGIVQGELAFDEGFRIVLRERLSFDQDSLIIDDYGYEIWHHEEKIAWYDSQPHPNQPELAETFPHHKHIHPNIKQNRIPAPEMSFTNPNLPVLIEEIENLIKEEGTQQ